MLRSGWLLYGTAVIAAAIAVALARVWMTGAVAAGVGAALSAGAAVVSERLRPSERPRHLRREWPDHLAKSQPGLLPRVFQLGDPADWGVHCTRRGVEHDGSRVTTPYVPRDVDGQMGEALSRGGFVLLLGESAAGKSRTAFEAVRRHLPDHAWVCPFTRRSIEVAVDAACRASRSVLWLDDLENYLGPDGLTEALVRRMLDHPRAEVVLVATIRSEEHCRYDAREGSRLTGADRDLWRTERGVVDQARVIRVERMWSWAEIERARQQAAPDRPLTLALRASSRYGIAESLACGPELVNAWRDAWSRGAHPRGAALVTAVVDYRRAGLRRPIPLVWARADHEPYLRARGGAQLLSAETLDRALAWACQPVRATSGLLVHDPTTDHLLAFDYLLACDGMEPVPDHLWYALLPRVTEEEAYDLGLVAHGELRLRRARAAFLKALQRPVSGAELALALVLADAGRPREAITLLEDLRRRGAGDPLTLDRQLAHCIAEAGEFREAVRRFADLARRTDQLLGPNHPDTLGVRHEAAYCAGEAGDLSTSVQELTALAVQRHRALGPDHPDTLATRRSLAWYQGMAGHADEAAAALHGLLIDAEAALGLRDPHVLAVRASLAWLRGSSGAWDRAARELTEVLHDRLDVLGADHPHTLATRQQIALATAHNGDRRQARDMLVRLVADMRGCLEPGHPHLAGAMHALEALS
ncbi:hypothetical protein [Streptomyces sp. NBC_00648]|uniref:hypothetical protein n=1 Tax=Streptomyces sp. NBC_00648 TaxID=2975797 RepID=UPI003248E36D